MQATHTNTPCERCFQHYFIEINFDHRISYGTLSELTDTSHKKNYFDSPAAFYQHLRHDLSQQKNVNDGTLIFFHGWTGERSRRFSGYVNSFHENYINNQTLNRTISIIWHTSGLMYSKSRNKVEAYAQTIANPFNELLAQLRSNALEFSVEASNHLLCYSMGNYLFQNIFNHIKSSSPLFGQIILAAADLDSDVFEADRVFNSLPKMSKKIIILQHRNDRLLGISKFILRRNRLGRHGLRSPSVAKNIEVFDVTPIQHTEGWKDKLTHHLYFYRSPEVVNYIRHIFLENIRTKRESSLRLLSY